MVVEFALTIQQTQAELICQRSYPLKLKFCKETSKQPTTKSRPLKNDLWSTRPPVGDLACVLSEPITEKKSTHRGACRGGRRGAHRGARRGGRRGARRGEGRRGACRGGGRRGACRGGGQRDAHRGAR